MQRAVRSSQRISPLHGAGLREAGHRSAAGVSRAPRAHSLGNRLSCSGLPQTLPCVVFLHGNSGCRVDAYDAVRVLLPLNITVFCLDLSGSGLSEG